MSAQLQVHRPSIEYRRYTQRYPRAVHEELSRPQAHNSYAVRRFDKPQLTVWAPEVSSSHTAAHVAM